MASEPCYAPVFAAGSVWTCIFQRAIYSMILFTLYLSWLFGGRSASVQCTIRQIQFRLRYCRSGNANPDINLSIGTYEEHVHDDKIQYGKSDAWEQWMLANRSRYIAVFEKAFLKPKVLTVAFRYDTTPIAYNPPWTSENQHMAALEALSELIFPGYDFSFVFGGNTTTSYGNLIAGIPTNSSQQSGKTIWLYYEGIFGHEFGHVMNLLHHYDTDAQTGTGQHMPPGDTQCLMDRNKNEFCSACRTALILPLNVNNGAAITAGINVISDRYPY